MNETIAKRVAYVDKLAKQKFGEHTIKTIHEDGVFRHYNCSHTEDSFYQFNITTFPDQLVISGRIGFLVVEHCHDMFEWAPSAVLMLEYFADNVQIDMSITEFDYAAAQNWIHDRMEKVVEDRQPDEKLLLDQLSDLKAALNLQCPEYFDSKLAEFGLVEEEEYCPFFLNVTFNFIWCYAAVKWFFEHFQEPQQV